VLSDAGYERAPFSSIRHLVERHHGIERARERASVFTEKARTIMGGFPESPYQRALLSVTDLINGRDR
jgi:geranylgeranyl pyrophosphate synthase